MKKLFVVGVLIAVVLHLIPTGIVTAYNPGGYNGHLSVGTYVGLPLMISKYNATNHLLIMPQSNIMMDNHDAEYWASWKEEFATDNMTEINIEFVESE